MNTPERGSFIISKIEHFVTHFGGDLEWGGEEPIDVDSDTSFSPRERVESLFSRRSVDAALGLGALVVGSVAISKLEVSLGLNHYFTQALAALFVHPWR